MGCGSSKLDDLPAVVICRHRLAFLDDALRHRHSLSQAHTAYLHSLASLADSLHHLLSLAASTDLDHGSSPVLHLPPHRKAHSDDHPPSGMAGGDSGHHLSLSDSSDDAEPASDGLHRLPSPSPLHPVTMGGGYDDVLEAMMEPFPGVFMHMNYTRKQPPSSASYGWRPETPERLRFLESSSSSSSSYPQHYYSTHQNPTSSASTAANYYNPPNPYAGYMDYYAATATGFGGFFGSSMHPLSNLHYASSPGHRQLASASPSSSHSKAAPPPPPAPSAWDFLNPFESLETNYPTYPSSRDSSEEEGIPDLEDDYQHEVVNEVDGDQKLLRDGRGNGASNRAGGKNYSNLPAEGLEDSGGEALYRPVPSPVLESDPPEHEVHVVDNKVVGGEGRSEDQGNIGVFTGERPDNFLSVSDAAREIQLQFQRASASGAELVKILDVGKLPYQPKNAAYRGLISSKMFRALTPVNSKLTSNHADLNLHANMELGSCTLSSTMQKLYLWEMKLLEEVKVEEKTRVIYDRNVQKLKRLDQRGAEAHKFDKTSTLVRSLSTRLRISIQVVDKISVKINKLRDEELWPQLNELIRGLRRMWKDMLECHHGQRLVVECAKGLDAISFPNAPSDAHLEATIKLEHDLLNWTMRFSKWVEAQRDYVRALNNWLLKCLFYEPGETADGSVPFSAGRAGAPPVFVICFQWCQALERISEKELVESMRVFSLTIFQFCVRDKVEMRRRMMAVRNLEKEDRKIQKEIQTLDKKILTISKDGDEISRNVVYQSDTRRKSNLHSGLGHMFESMDRYVEESFKAYDELLQRCVQVVREHAGVS